MNQMLFPKDVTNAIQSFVLVNEGERLRWHSSLLLVLNCSI